MSALADEIVRSLAKEPHRWSMGVLSLKRDDGLAVDVIKPFVGPARYARLSCDQRGNPLFGWWDTGRIQRAYRRWLFRPWPNYDGSCSLCGGAALGRAAA